jgi:D-sedoheptulose 7-phosphate isomerase
MEDTVLRAIGEHIAVMERLKELSEDIMRFASAVNDVLKDSGKVVLFGNGGSACDAQHIAAEMLGITAGRDSKRGLLAISLADNTALLTAVGNDLGYEEVFSRQVEAIVQKRDLVIGISTSGSSPNVINGLSAAKRLGAKTVALTGEGGDLAKMADIAIPVPSDSVPRIQEAHITIGHIVCEVAQRAMRKEYLTRFSP